MKKNLNYIFFIALVLIVSLMSKESVNMLLTIVFNYQSPSIEMLSGLPMYLALIIIYIIAFLFIDIVKNKNDLIIRIKRISIAIIILSFLGSLASIFVGIFVYNSFFDIYVFRAYPFLMLLFHLFCLILFTFIHIRIKRQIINSIDSILVPKITMKSILKIFAYETIMIYAGSYLGEFLLLFNVISINSWMIIPFYIQITIPAIEFILYIVYKVFIKDKYNKRFVYISTFSCLSFSIVSLILTLIAYYSNPILVTTLTSPFMQIERVIGVPICFILIYIVSFSFTISNIVIMITRKIKNN